MSATKFVKVSQATYDHLGNLIQKWKYEQATQENLRNCNTDFCKAVQEYNLIVKCILSGDGVVIVKFIDKGTQEVVALEVGD